MLNPIYSRERQERMLRVLHDRRLDAIVLGLPQHVYYASAHRPFWLHSSGFVLFANGRSVVATANAPQDHAADDVISFDATWMGTQRQEQPAVVADHVRTILQHRHTRRIGIDASAVTSQMAIGFDGTVESIDSEMWQMRRSKLPDELELMRKAVLSTEAMYRRAKEMIEPGLGELELFTELHAVAVKTSQEPLTALLGNDFACGTGGGPPRKNHHAKSGQLWILDLGPTYRGYFADNARTFAVDRKPTDIQVQTWNAINRVFPIVERMAKPGVHCRDLFNAADEHLRQSIGQGLSHHLGHGVGLQPHEFPHLNPKWDDVLIEGDVFTAEPGIYGKELNGGIRLENQYLVTATGVENLTNFPMELT